MKFSTRNSPSRIGLATLTSLFLLNQVARHFGDLVGKGLGGAVIGEFFALSIPFIIAMTTPMAVLIATLYAFSRLAAENEITALRASGVDLKAGHQVGELIAGGTGDRPVAQARTAPVADEAVDLRERVRDEHYSVTPAGLAAGAGPRALRSELCR